MSNGSTCTYSHNSHSGSSHKNLAKASSFEVSCCSAYPKSRPRLKFNVITLLFQKQSKKKPNIYVDVPHPPKYLDLSANGDFSEYVQSDCMVCPIGTPTSNRMSECSSSILNDTIPECIEFDPSEVAINADKRLELPSHSYCNFSQSEFKKQMSDCKTNSLKTPSKHKRKHQVKSKVKSVENLLYGSMTPYASSWEPSNFSLEQRHRQHSPYPLSTFPTELSACQVLCDEPVKLDDSSTPATDEPETNVDNDEVTFEFDKAPPSSEDDRHNRSAPPSDNEESVNNSRKSSSLDLSSLSLNSNCTVDENGDIKCSLELKISEPAEHDTETVPPLENDNVEADNSYLNLCKLPDYMNVNGMSKETQVASRFKYATTVS